MIYYIPSREEMINSDHIIRAEFSPKHIVETGTDDMSGQPYPKHSVSATLVLWLTELRLDELCGYEGSTRGTASVSKSLEYRGLEAEYLWDALKRSAYGLSTFPSKEEKQEMGVPENA
jgi:hypothetical protein